MGLHFYLELYIFLCENAIVLFVALKIENAVRLKSFMYIYAIYALT